MSSIAWLDTSPEDQRRIREIIAMFSDKGTLDELGIGQIRDAFGDFLFPGTSTIQTRARYFLFVPWAFQKAVAQGQQRLVKSRAAANERMLIEAIRKSGEDITGLIGSRTGAKVKTLPSAIYWSGLTRFGILTSGASTAQIGIPHRAHDDVGELSDRIHGDWSATLPPPPTGFPTQMENAFEMPLAEAEWLRERIITSVPESLLTHLLTLQHAPDPESWAPWDDDAARSAPPRIAAVLEDARLFSLCMHGAALLYNVLVAEKYEAAGHTAQEGTREDYIENLKDWAEEVQEESEALRSWKRQRIWELTTLPPTVSIPTRTFVTTWVEAVISGSANEPANKPTLRDLVAAREKAKKGNQSRLTNERMLANWSGASGNSRLIYRWPTVRTLVTDIQAGIYDAQS